MVKQAFDVYGLGQCALDYIGTVDGYPEPDVKCEMADLVIQGGGPVWLPPSLPWPGGEYLASSPASWATISSAV